MKKIKIQQLQISVFAFHNIIIIQTKKTIIGTDFTLSAFVIETIRGTPENLENEDNDKII